MKQRITCKDARLLKREIKAMTYRAKGPGEKEKARRVSAMVHEQLKADNGVIRAYDEGPGNSEHKKAFAAHLLTPETAQGIEEFLAEDAEREKDENDGQG